MVGPHIVTVECRGRYRSVGVPPEFAGFHPVTQWTFFSVLQHRAQSMGPVEEMVWTAQPDPLYKPPPPPPPKQLGLF